MNTPSDFDRAMRQRHAASLHALSPQTLARLRQARQAAVTRPARGRAFTWLGASACAAALAVVAATQLMPHHQSSPALSQPATIALHAGQDSDPFASTADVLDQNPDLYVWLGSDASPTLE